MGFQTPDHTCGNNIRASHHCCRKLQTVFINLIHPFFSGLCRKLSLIYIRILYLQISLPHSIQKTSEPQCSICIILSASANICNMFMSFADQKPGHVFCCMITVYCNSRKLTSHIFRWSLISQHNRTLKSPESFQDFLIKMNSLKNQSVNISFQHIIHQKKSLILVKIIIADNHHFIMLHTYITDLLQMKGCDRISYICFQNSYQSGVSGNQTAGCSIGTKMKFLNTGHNPPL